MYVCTYVTENAARDLGHTYILYAVISEIFSRCPRPGVLLLGVVVCFVVFGCYWLLMSIGWLQMKLVGGFEFAIVRRKTHFIVLEGGRGGETMGLER